MYTQLRLGNIPKHSLIRYYSILYLILFFSFYGVSINAQIQEEHQGYIITLDQDTLNGQIIFKDKKTNPEQVIFLNKRKETIYTPDKIMGFGISNGLIFESAKIKYSTNPYQINRLSESKEILWGEKTVFLRTLLLGQLNLYEYVDETLKLHFFTKKDNVYDELINLKYKKEGKIAEINKYKNQLKILMQDCRDMFEPINKTKFRKEAIQSVIKDYHQCKNQSILYIHKKEKLGLDVSFYSGISLSTYSLKNHPSIPDVKTNSGPNFTANLDFEYVIPRNNKTWSIVTGIGYRSYQVEPGKNLFELSDQSLEYLRLNATLKKIIFSKKIKIGLYFGINNSFTLNKARPEMSNEQGLLIGLNSQIKNFKFDVRFENANGYSPFPRIDTRVNTLFFRVGYSIFKSKSLQ